MQEAILKIGRVSKSHAWLEIVFVRVPETAMLCVGEDQSTLYAEAAGRNLGDWIGGVSRLGLRFDRAADGGVKAADVSVVALSSCPLQLVAQTEIQGEPASHLPVVVNESPIVEGLIRPRRVSVDESSGRQTEQEGSEVLSNGRSG